MLEQKKLARNFYKDYVSLHDFFEKTTSLSNEDISNIINTEIIFNFLESSKMKIYKNYFVDFMIENKQIETKYPKSYDKLKKTINKYNWTLDNDKPNSLTPDLLGKVFEKTINQKENGAYYTDNDTINYINRNSILMYITKGLYDEIDLSKDGYHNFYSKLVKTANEKEINLILYKLENIKIADISCGTGAFLVNALEYIYYLRMELYEKLGREISKSKVLFEIVNQTLYGVDIMSSAVNICKFRIILKSIQIMYFEHLPILDLKFIPKIIAANTLTDNINNKFEIDNLKFDVILGNPPYVEYRKINNYRVENYFTLVCGNIYAFMMEKSLQLLTSNGVLGLIVPISLVSTTRMSKLRKLLLEQSSKLYLSNFADRPGTLFNGVHQKLTIVLLQQDCNKKSEVFTSSYIHWYESERENLFNKIEYTPNSFITDVYIPKLGNSIEKSIFKKIISNTNSLKDMLFSDGLYSLFLNMRATFWIKCFLNEVSSTEYKKLSFENKHERDIAYLILNSDIFYFYWEVLSDGWHITLKDLDNFTLPSDITDKISPELASDLVEKFDDDLERKKVYIGSKQTDYIYQHKKSKLIIDEINILIGKALGFNSVEIDYIKNYNISVRLNNELDSYLESRK